MLIRLPQFGQKAIGRKLFVTNKSNPRKNHYILIQANKNHSIVNIVHVVDGKHIRLSDVISNFQGCQADDELVMERLINVLYEKLN